MTWLGVFWRVGYRVVSRKRSQPRSPGPWSDGTNSGTGNSAGGLGCGPYSPERVPSKRQKARISRSSYCAVDSHTDARRTQDRLISPTQGDGLRSYLRLGWNRRLSRSSEGAVERAETCSSKLPKFPSWALAQGVGPLPQGLERRGLRGGHGGLAEGPQAVRSTVPLFSATEPGRLPGALARWSRCRHNRSMHLKPNPPSPQEEPTGAHHTSLTLHTLIVHCAELPTLQHCSTLWPRCPRPCVGHSNHLFARGRQAVNRLSPKKIPPPHTT